MTKALSLAALLTLSLTLPLCAVAPPAPDSSDLSRLAQDAVSENEGAAHSAILRLRQAGQPGLDALYELHRSEITERLAHPVQPPADAASWKRLASALDAVGMQKDDFASHLYWRTDLEDAKAAAKIEQKPILSLRLLGRLDVDLSCANSRFFRTALYANAEVSAYLRSHFILHWQSERPAPKITIDFGDGRVLERTITGNSVHYILDSQGLPVDALPGLYAPKPFMERLQAAEQEALQCGGLHSSPRLLELRRYHSTEWAGQKHKWTEELRALGIAVTAEASPGGGKENPAGKADRRAITKSAIERPLLAAMTPPAEMLAKASEPYWARLGHADLAEMELDQASIALLQIKSACDNLSKSEAPLSQKVQRFTELIAEDTTRNENLLHGQIRSWFISAAAPLDLETLHQRIYSELFLTPRSDPWLGLHTGDYTALDGDGIRKSSAASLASGGQ